MTTDTKAAAKRSGNIVINSKAKSIPVYVNGEMRRLATGKPVKASAEERQFLRKCGASFKEAK